MIGVEDGEKFFEIVQTTPDLLEAEQLLRGALAVIAQQMAEAGRRNDNHRQSELGALKRRVRLEIHHIQLIRDETTWQEAVRAVCGEQGYADCMTWIVAKRAEARGIDSPVTSA